MSEEKFLKDVKILLDFIELYCKDKHNSQKNFSHLTITYQYKPLEEISYKLCLTCKENFLYSYERLQECPHEEKPRCRHCKNTCYEKSKWKNLAQIMRYSGMKKGLTKIKRFFKT